MIKNHKKVMENKKKVTGNGKKWYKSCGEGHKSNLKRE